jgi:hypothetical protein
MGLYKKEQLVIGIVLLGFAVSGISLPIIKEQIYQNDMPQETICTTYQTAENTNDTETDEIGSGLENANDDIENAGSDRNTENEQSTKDSEKTVNNGGTINNVKDKNANSKDSNPSPNPPSPKTTTTPTASSGSSDSPEKVWVPPVYKTVHHEAVYETKKVYICNYCSATFNSAGEFQVHKDENGG